MEEEGKGRKGNTREQSHPSTFCVVAAATRCNWAAVRRKSSTWAMLTAPGGTPTPTGPASRPLFPLAAHAWLMPFLMARGLTAWAGEGGEGVDAAPPEPRTSSSMRVDKLIGGADGAGGALRGSSRCLPPHLASHHLAMRRRHRYFGF